MEENNKKFIEKYFNDLADDVLNIDAANNEQVKKIINATKKMMNEVKSGITYTQLRNVYQLFKVESLDFKKLQLTRPKLAYIQARLEKNEGKKFMELIDDFIEKIDTDASISQRQINNLQEFMQSIVAYHKLNA